MLHLKSYPAGIQIQLQHLQAYLGKYIGNQEGIKVLTFAFTWNLGA